VIVLSSAGVVVFDPGGSAWAGEMVIEKIKSISREPVVALFGSHAHGDHWLGNEGIKRAYPDAIIYGHPTMKDRVTGADGDFWLAQIEKLTEGTAGGKQVIAPDRVVNDGDVIRNGLLGIMEADASFAGNIAAIDVIMEKNFKYYIPGHGRIGGIEIAWNYRTYLDTLLSKVRELYARQIADFEMKPIVIDAVSAYSDWAGFDIRIGPHISRAYLEVEMEEF